MGFSFPENISTFGSQIDFMFWVITILTGVVFVLVEVAGAISRTRQAPAQAQAFAMALRRLPHVTVRVLDEGCALHALTLAAQHGLRGADAVYAAVAHEAGSTLVTLDYEHLMRLVPLITVCTPAVALAGLIPPPPSPA